MIRFRRDDQSPDIALSERSREAVQLPIIAEPAFRGIRRSPPVPRMPRIREEKPLFGHTEPIRVVGPM